VNAFGFFVMYGATLMLYWCSFFGSFTSMHDPWVQFPFVSLAFHTLFLVLCGRLVLCSEFTFLFFFFGIYFLFLLWFDFSIMVGLGLVLFFCFISHGLSGSNLYHERGKVTCG